MTTLIVPLLKCNLSCKYCFAEAYKWCETKEYDTEKILSKMDEVYKTRKDDFCLHGGECTLIDRTDLELFLKKMYDLTGSSALQTNCYKIDDKLIELYKKYKTAVGVSIDGNGSLNSLRGGFKQKAQNERYTQQVIDNISRLKAEGVGVGIIIVLSKANADSKEKLANLVKFILLLKEKGIRGGRLNLMWSNHEKSKQYELTVEEASEAWVYLYENLKKDKEIQWQPFREMTDNLLGLTHASCSFGKCDYQSTTTMVILGNGTLGNCDRTHQDSELSSRREPSFKRYEVLKETQCKGCKFWNVCYGGCPAEGSDGNFDNKSRWCGAIFSIYSAIENDLKCLLPNIKLVSDFPNSTNDYYEDIKKGRYHHAFEAMDPARACRPSSWKYVRYKDNKNYGPHIDHTNAANIKHCKDNKTEKQQ